MKILVTGGAGFIGSDVIRAAIRQGHSVLNLDALTYAACLENLREVEDRPNYFFKKCDIRKKQDLNEIIDSYAPDCMIHLAAESHVDKSINIPSDFIDTNILGTFNLLEAARAYWTSKDYFSQFRFVHVSTDEVYGSLPLNTNRKFNEESCYNPNSPYSASKAASDHLARAWYKTYNLPTIITNCSNNYGPFQYPEKLIPVTIMNALEGKQIPVYGDGLNVRDWLHVSDHSAAILKILKEGKPGKNYSIGGDNEYSNIALVSKICQKLEDIKPRIKGHYSDLIKYVDDRLGHDRRYAIDSARLRSELQWKPLIDFESGIDETIKWYINNQPWCRQVSKKRMKISQ